MVYAIVPIRGNQKVLVECHSYLSEPYGFSELYIVEVIATRIVSTTENRSATAILSDTTYSPYSGNIRFTWTEQGWDNVAKCRFEAGTDEEAMLKFELGE